MGEQDLGIDGLVSTHLPSNELTVIRRFVTELRSLPGPVGRIRNVWSYVGRVGNTSRLSTTW